MTQTDADLPRSPRLRDVVTTPQREAAYVAAGFWDDVTLLQRVRRHVVTSPVATAIVDSLGTHHTYAELDSDSNRVAGFLAGAGVSTGDVVAVQLPNWYASVAIAIGVLKAGAVINPMLPAYRTNELRHMLNVGRTSVIFTPREYRGADHVKIIDGLRVELPSLTHHVVIDGDTEGDIDQIRSFFSRHSNVPQAVERSASEVAELMFTSGTEAAPKAIMHTERTLNFSSRATWKALGMSSSDVVWMPAPIGHSTGFNHGVRLALFHGVQLVLQERWDTARAVDVVRQEQCTHTLLSPTFLRDLVEECRKQAISIPTMRLFGCGGAPINPDLVTAAAECGIECLRLYGSTEVLVATWNPPSASVEKKLTTDGSPFDGVEIEVRDEAGKRCGPDEPGELYTRSPSGCVGFFHDPERTGATISSDGWVKSGDLAQIDADRYLTIVGRKKEIIIRGGLNIAPREVEDLILQIPGVRAASVVGLPDERLGETACACVVLEPNAELTFDVMVDRLKAAGLATFKLPERLVLVPELPATATGKIRKHVLVAAIRGGSTSS